MSMVANGKSVVDPGAHIVVECYCLGCTQIRMPFQMDQDRKQQAREMEVVLCTGTKVEQAGGGGWDLAKEEIAGWGWGETKEGQVADWSTAEIPHRVSGHTHYPVIQFPQACWARSYLPTAPPAPGGGAGSVSPTTPPGCSV